MKEENYRKFLLAVLLAGFMFNNLDRWFLGIAMQPIKVDLSLSDTQLGLLTGLAYAVFYSVLGFPIARLADSGDRVWLMSVTTALSSIAVALCGAAGSFVQLILLRVTVAVGETGFMPTANSLISEYFTRSQRARAMSVYLLGGPISLILGYLLGGWLLKYYGWRWSFVILGSPGLLVAVAMWLGTKEPRRTSPQRKPAYASSSSNSGRAETDRVSLRAFLKIVMSSPTFRHLLYSFVVLSFFDCARSQWLATFFIRSFGFDTATLGAWFALIYGPSGLIGTYLGGWLCERYFPNNERVQLRLIAGIFIACGVLSALVCVSGKNNAFIFTAISAVLGTATGAPFYSMLQTLVPERLRAQATAFIFLVSNLIGLGLGPLAAGALSDGLSVRFGSDSLRYTLLALSPGFLWCAYHSWVAGRTVASDLAKVEMMADVSSELYSDEAPSAKLEALH